MTTAPAAAGLPAFRARYPEFATTISDPLYDELFEEAGAFNCDNGDCGIVPCDAVTYQPRLMLLNMVVAHLAMIGFGSANGPASPLVGRIDKATQGSVSVGTGAYGRGTNAMEAFYTQTPYGARFWAATVQYRSFMYVAPDPTLTDYPGAFPWQR